MRLAYFDCFSGLSGDMALAALIHAGADFDSIAEALHSFPAEDFSLQGEEVDVRGLSALRVHIESGPQGVIRTYANIRALLEGADLPEDVRRTAHRMYHRLANAAAKVHGKDPELVTFVEFGELDCLVEFVGCALALHQLGVDRVFASPIPTGLGMARTEHGIMPIPSPVVMELLQGVPTYSRGIPVELVTPTGAAILAAVSEGYGDMPLMRADHVGYGAGHLRLDFPNAVRVVIGEEQRAGTGARLASSLEDLLTRGDVLIQATLPGLDEQTADAMLQQIGALGARDAWFSPLLGRIGEQRVGLSIVAPAGRREAIVQLLSSAGVVGEVLVSPVLIVPTSR